MTVTEHAPARPRRASAGTRRHHRKYLTHRIRQVVPAAHTVIVLPVRVDGGDERVFTAVVRDASGVQLMLADGDSRRLACLLQGAFTADWTRAQTWRADTNQLTAWRPVDPDYVATVEAGFIEADVDAWFASLPGEAS